MPSLYEEVTRGSPDKLNPKGLFYREVVKYTDQLASAALRRVKRQMLFRLQLDRLVQLLFEQSWRP